MNASMTTTASQVYMRIWKSILTHQGKKYANREKTMPVLWSVSRLTCVQPSSENASAPTTVNKRYATMFVPNAR